MKALIFAAGLGERMRPLTLHTPKPLLPVAGKPLIVSHLERLAALGVRDVVVNISWLAEAFAPTLGDGRQWGVQLHFVNEGDTPLETGGGILNALPVLGDAPFLVVNGDIWTDFDFATLPREPAGQAHLVMVDNPAQHPQGDYRLDAAGLLHHDRAGACLTYAGIGVYRPSIVANWRQVIGTAAGSERTPPRFSVVPLQKHFMAQGSVTGQHHRGRWTDVGTVDRLRLLDLELGRSNG
ncbi:MULTISPECIES: N-acetylmuramate alpha-1-phosphate uridylyltransferase MurU [unclassified Stenotrophomonas]|uniref:N-acetylmuramate alpha-1-phosphate uridylyltransferase MurU n=1 Tax=unclassified Stenotrophomonas TaxID=196198 RepID=UPI0017804716|nr:MULTISPECIES: nucleotidyltransferase family protein [unclassified Stenotrophomonas]MBD8642309.1 nucleotidyltransferase family protein [Stenotrophomonas sp. CFBP 13724]MDY1032862.1 nucleotidyltransferase family protein [Stenotrophomonas sp. CFBP8980]